MTTNIATSPWRVLVPIGLGTSLALIGDASLYAVLPTHVTEAGVAITTVGILLSANRFIRLILNGVVGWVYDRSPRRYLFVTALFIGAGSTTIYGITSGFWPLLGGRLLWGLAWAGIWIGGNTIILDVSEPRERGRWVGIYQAFFFMGGSGGAMLGGFLTDWLGYHRAMGIGATLTFTGAVIAWLFLPETRNLRLAENALKLPALPEAFHDSPARPWSELASAFGLMAVNRLVLAGVLLPTLGLFLLGQVGESTQVAGFTVGVATLTGIALGASGLISMLAIPVMGGLSDRASHRWQVAAGGLLPGMAGFGLLAFASPLALVLAVPLTAVTGGSNQVISTTLVGDLSAARQRGQRLGILFTIGDLASAIGPPLAYGLIPQLGLSGVYLLSVGVIGLMFLIALQWAVRLTLAGRGPAYGIDQ